MEYIAGDYDIVVVGAGHAGCEAGLACARLGFKTLITTINLDSVAMMPCNPSIGGTAKGHLVREIDALGGEMGKNIDKAFIQSRMINTAKGPAVHSLRAQADKSMYQQQMKKTLEKQENLEIRQTETKEIIVEDGKVTAIKTNTGAIYKCKAAILATGTYLRSRVIIGEVNYSSGPNGLFPANYLSENLKKLGIRLMRFKTGTPARVNKRSLDLEKMKEQPGDEKIIPFSFMSGKLDRQQISCWLTYTNETTHEIIRKNINRSPLYSGQIKGVGPRYCPSIEDKVVRFKEKTRHQVFIEPEGENTLEMYVQGLSSSLPEDVQIEVYRTLPGMENVEIMRTAYAIEYDCIDPTQLKLSLEFKDIEGLFGAGQINGSSGYEEAAAQGLIAGINAVRKIENKEPLILDRSDAYIGVLIDDLVTKGTNEPYRMMTSRAEYRLLLRQDNADLRLTEIGRKVGLVDDERYKAFKDKKNGINKELERIKNTIIKPNEKVQKLMIECGSKELKSGITIYDLLKRPELNYEKIEEIDVERPHQLSEDIMQQVEIQVKYEGYIKRQMNQVKQYKRLENKIIPEDIDYNDIKSLRIEAKQKLADIRPRSIGQASRISGVSPADVSVLLVYIEQINRKKADDK
ncbi:MAG: tRNA uridine-5-carboxymethylaminomethyl(34) synthesis enzyme MnmG [Clostridia bacterium]|nr:tRNA uridine-5-carboxymethylaminomethyl(34) synthesis enzyme MnmG [Clostridia bacterium]